MILVKLVDLFELGMEDAASENLLKLIAQLDMVIQIIRLKWGGVCGKCTHILSPSLHNVVYICRE